MQNGRLLYAVENLVDVKNMGCIFLNIYYRPQTKFAKVMFSQVSVCPQGGYLGRYPPPPPRAGTPPGQVHPQAGTPPPGQVPPGRYTPSHSACWDTVNKWAVRIPLECILLYEWNFIIVLCLIIATM